jgi:hypothetical protein
MRNGEMEREREREKGGILLFFFVLKGIFLV